VAFGWLGRVAVRWGRGRGWAALGVVVVPLVAVLLGTLAAAPFYRITFSERWPGRVQTIADVWSDVTTDSSTAYSTAALGAYRPAMLAHAGLTLAALALVLLLWLRLGAQAALARRAMCSGCQHTLTGLPLVEAAEQDSLGPRSVRCPECAALHPVLPAWGEVNAQTQRFVPATGLVQLFWTRRRVKTGAVTAAGVVLLAGAVWAGQWAWSHIDARRQAAAAVAARLSPEQVTQRILAFRAAREAQGGAPAPEGAAGMGPSRLELVGHLADRITAITEAFMLDWNVRMQGVTPSTAGTFLIAPLRLRSLDDATPVRVADQLLYRLLAEGVEHELDALTGAPVPGPFPFVPRDAPAGPEDGQAASLTIVHKANLALLRVAVKSGDLHGLIDRLATAEALEEASRACLPVHQLHALMVGDVFQHIEWASRVRGPAAMDRASNGEVNRARIAAWYDALRTTADRLPLPDPVVWLDVARWMLGDEVALHFAAAERVRRGLADTTIMEGVVTWPGRADSGSARLGGFRESMEAVNAVVDARMDRLGRVPWTVERYGGTGDPHQDLYFGRLASHRVHNASAGLDSITLAARSVRITVRVERFIALSPEGRPPTPEELPGVLGPDVDFTDPFTGRPLRYRITDHPADTSPNWPTDWSDSWPRRPYVLYAAGLDGTDDGGRMGEFTRAWLPPNFSTGTDVILPYGVLSP